MSISFPEYSNSEFPEQLDSFPRMQDITSSEVALMNDYKRFITNADISSAQSLLESNPSLRDKLFDASKFNSLRDAILSTQKFFTTNVQGFVENKQREMNQYTDNKKTEINREQSNAIETINQKRQEVLEEVGKFYYRGIYSKIVQYYRWNTVKFRGNVYLCFTDTINNDPTNEAFWIRIADNGDKVVLRGTWTQIGEYKHLDMVTYNNNLYMCELDNYNKNPELETSFWRLIMSNRNNDRNNHYTNYRNGKFTLNHNLGEYPLVQAIVNVTYGHSGYGMFGMNSTYQLDNIVEYIDANSCKIHFAEEFKGTPTITQNKPREFTITYSNDASSIKVILK